MNLEVTGRCPLNDQHLPSLLSLVRLSASLWNIVELLAEKRVTYWGMCEVYSLKRLRAITRARGLKIHTKLSPCIRCARANFMQFMKRLTEIHKKCWFPPPVVEDGLPETQRACPSWREGTPTELTNKFRSFSTSRCHVLYREQATAAVVIYINQCKPSGLEQSTHSSMFSIVLTCP